MSCIKCITLQRRTNRRINCVKLLSLFIAVIFLIMLLSIPAGAASYRRVTTDNDNVSAGRVWSGKADTSWYNSSKDSFDISTPEQLAGLAELVNGGSGLMEGKKFRLVNDIYLNDPTDYKNWSEKPPANEWTPIGKSGNPISGYYPFCGILDGNGHSIYGLYINHESYHETFRGKYGETCVGLFGYTYGAIIANLALQQGYVCGTRKGEDPMCVGSIIGVMENSYITGCYSDLDVRCYYTNADGMMSEANVGGFVGEIGTENYSGALFYLTFAAGGFFINPLLVGDSSFFSASYIVDSMFAGSVYANARYYENVGGFVGFNMNGQLHNCYMTGTYNSNRGKYTFSYVASLCGHVQGYIYENCYVLTDEKGTNVYVHARSEATELEQINKTDVIKKGEINSAATLKKLGKGFKKTNGEIIPAKINFPTVNIAIKGKKAGIYWKPMKNAKSYTIYIKGSDGKYSKIKTVTGSRTTLNNISKGKKYSLLIKASLNDGTTKTLPDGRFVLTT